MNIGWKPLAWSAAALLLLLTIPTPLSGLTFFMIMAPFTVLYTLLRPAVFAAYAAVVGAAAFLLLGSYGLTVLVVGLFFLVPTIVMGHMYKKKSKARTVVLAGFGVILAQMLINLVIISMEFRVNLSAELSKLLAVSLGDVEKAGMLPAGWAAQTAHTLADAFIQMLPLFVLLFSFLLAVINHGLARRALRISGVEVPALPRAKDWKLPRSLFWYFLIALLLSYTVPRQGSAYWTIVSANLLPLLILVFTVQAIGFLYYLADAKRWPKVVPVLIAVPLVCLNVPVYIVGLLDVAFPLRRYFVK
ncbi:DUF2232 domain-containing protein [Cohnella pontilimi]|uniref:DUF2232 domain-containing protein n=1 Tax=Cohnella pontilimi TaxID=2564100 RepID=UPI00145FCA4E|nr:DUF2232 domain-containing protein [Cohnella pontilimi]